MSTPRFVSLPVRMSVTCFSLKSSSAKSVSALSGVLDARVGTLEVEARRDFLVGLVHRVADLDLIHFGDDIERRHVDRPQEE